ncbi:hypothetical protein EUX98_g17 [Antrodiella citrinella]|uniref:DUF2415 domain-containing protein n=1 Tax=Antrodiella citrinella TaxID=2447956 RepID=A0A4S4N4Y2_9APHY|nr:hypothetical protein EUX98_g17 [Antrodiella citrinella]
MDALLNHSSLQKPASYAALEKPHPDSSPLARYRNVPNFTPPSPLAQAVAQARFSTTSTRIDTPVNIRLPQNSACLALIGAGGYKNRDPELSYFLLDETDDYGFCKEVSIPCGLLEVAYQIDMDPTRKLIYVADSDRIKSYWYDGKKHGAKHTLNPKGDGPIMLVENGSKLLRAGRSGVDMWNVDTLPDHGPDGRKKIGKGKVSIEDSWRDEEAYVEPSTGTAAHASVSLHADAIQPTTWSLLPNGHMIVSPKNKYSCWTADLESGLKPVTKFIGHGGPVSGFSTSPQDPNSFLTSSDDGLARLFDIRQPLPSISFDCGSSSERLRSALYVYVEGLPLVITGGMKSECITVWEPRMKTALYTLATGNNSVSSLAWDAPRSTLFAATECEYMDRLGYHHDYRPAKIPRSPYNKTAFGEWYGEKEHSDDDENMEDEDDADDEDEDDDEHFWPERAYHDEDAFGYTFDSGDHRLFRYKFGVDVDSKEVPEYGDARPSNGDW